MHLFYIILNAFLFNFSVHENYFSLTKILKKSNCQPILETDFSKKYLCSGHTIVLFNESNFVGIDSNLIYTDTPIFCNREDCLIPTPALNPLLNYLNIKQAENPSKPANIVEFFPILNIIPRNKFILSIARNAGFILIDPGHGGKDEGAVGMRGIAEKDVALDISLYLEKKLKEFNFNVRLTRRKDEYLSLEERSKIAVELQPSVFLSIHANWAENREAKGVELYYPGFYASDIQAQKVVMVENIGKNINEDALKIVADLILFRQTEQSYVLASSLNYYFSQAQQIAYRGVKRGPFWLLLSAGAPSVLVETGFLSNSEEEEKLSDPEYRKFLAEILFTGLINYLNANSPNNIESLKEK